MNSKHSIVRPYWILESEILETLKKIQLEINGQLDCSSEMDGRKKNLKVTEQLKDQFSQKRTFR